MSDLRARLNDIWNRTRWVFNAPHVQVRLYGDHEASTSYRSFTARHRVFKLTQSKRWGVALVRLPQTFEDYIGGGSNELLRRKRRRAQKAGFRYAVISPQGRIDEIVEINRSAPSRQGRPMAAWYLDRESVASVFSQTPEIHAVLDSEGRLRAYAIVPVIGDAFVFSTILGHADDLEFGTMYLLVSEVIRTFIEQQSRGSGPCWAMYDTFWGASMGLRSFKERLGFRPYTVDWVWSGAGAATGQLPAD
jgi:hypothetical protein